MAADREVLREFLATLGFSVDQPSLRAFLGAFKATSEAAVKTTAAILGTVAAGEAMVISFARNFERLYYASTRTKSTVANLQALEFGAQQIGLSAETARELVEGLARALRITPQSAGILKMLGIEHEGRDRVSVLLDLVDKLKQRFKGPYGHAIGAQFAEMFGIDEQTFLMLKERLPELRAAMQVRKDMMKDTGVDAEAAAKAAREFMNELRELWEMIGLVKDSFAIQLLPVFREFNAIVKSILGDLAKVNFSELDVDFKLLAGFVDEQIKKWGDWWTAINKVKNEARAGDQSQGFWADLWDSITLKRARRMFGGRDATIYGPGDLTGPEADEQERRQREIYGPGDLTGPQAEAMDKIRLLMAQIVDPARSGTWDSELAREIARTARNANIPLRQAYAPPGSAAEFATGGGGQNITFAPSVQVTVTGAKDPAATGREVGAQVNRVMGDAVRNFAGAVR